MLWRIEHYEIGGEITREQFEQVYAFAIQQPHDFLLIDFAPKPTHKSRFRRNFNEYIVLQCPPSVPQFASRLAREQDRALPQRLAVEPDSLRIADVRARAHHPVVLHPRHRNSKVLATKLGKTMQVKKSRHKSLATLSRSHLKNQNWQELQKRSLLVQKLQRVPLLLGLLKLLKGSLQGLQLAKRLLKVLQSER